MNKYEQYARERAEHFKALGDYDAALEWANTAHRYFTADITEGRIERAMK
jgi:hypothetical protein